MHIYQGYQILFFIFFTSLHRDYGVEGRWNGCTTMWYAMSCAYVNCVCYIRMCDMQNKCCVKCHLVVPLCYSHKPHDGIFDMPFFKPIAN